MPGDGDRESFDLPDGADIFLLGSGVFSFFDLTLYTQFVLEECRAVFFLHDLPSLERYLERLVPDPVNLMPLYYVDGRDRADIYEDVARHVVEAARLQRPVALLTHGHPLVYCDISKQVRQQAGRHGLRVSSVPAVSSLDRMFVDLDLDIGDHGVQVLHASAAISQATPLNPDLDTIFFQVGSIMEPTAARLRESTVDEMAPLKDYLLRFFPPSHRVTIIESPVELGFEARKTEVAVGELETAAPACNYNASAFVPALSRRA